jgi:putative SOS response-associated peptidase YedK
LTASPEQLARHFELDETPELEPRFNVAPGQDVAVVRRSSTGRRVLEMRRWGLVPAWADDPRIGNRMINARAETAAGKAAYRRAFQQRRCLVPADGFYEWAGRAGSREPYHVTLGRAGLFGMAGLWERWRGAAGGIVESCAILTTDANERLRPLHDRMPVILDPAAYARWLDPTHRDPAELGDLLRPWPANDLALRRVGRRVNDAALDEPGLLDPPAAGSEPAQLGLEFQE